MENTKDLVDQDNKETTTTQVEPTNESTQKDSGANEKDIDVKDLLKKVTELESKLSHRNNENADKRNKLKSVRTQYDELVNEFDRFKSEATIKDSELSELKKQLEEFQNYQKSEFENLLNSMKPEHQEKFKDFTLAQLKTVHAELYGSEKKVVTPSVGKDKPANTDTTNIELKGIDRIKAALKTID